MERLTRFFKVSRRILEDSKVDRNKGFLRRWH